MKFAVAVSASITAMMLVAGSPVQAETVVKVWRGSLGPAWDKLEDEIISEFKEANPEITIEETPMPWSTFREKLFTGFRLGGDLPCVVWEGMNLASSYVSAGGLAPIDEYVGEWGYTDLLPENVVSASKVDGKMYALPFGGIPHVTFYNKEYFEEAGVEPPTTWEEWLDVSQKLKDAGYDAWAVRTDRLLQAYFQELLWQAGGQLFEDGVRAPGGPNSEIAFDSETGVRALEELMARAEFAPGGLEGNIGMKGPDVIGMFASGQTAMQSGSIHGYGQILAINPGMKDNVGVFLNPVGPSGEPVDFLISQALFLTEACENKDEAAKFMEFYIGKKWEEKRATELGYAPLRSDITDPAVVNDPIISVGMEAVRRGMLQPDFPAWLEFRNVLMNEIQRVFLGDATAKEALEQAAEQLTASMKSR